MAIKLVDGAPSVSAMAVAAEGDYDDIPMAMTEFVPCEDQTVERRPSIISVTVLKRTPEQDVGILIEEGDDGLRISSIDSEGLFWETPIDDGDHVLSVNNASCEQQNAAYVSRLLNRSKRAVSLMVHRPYGDPYLVSTTVTKPKSPSRVGIGVQIYDGSLRVSSIDPSGLFAGSILNVGDKVVSICGMSCACMDSSSTIELIRQEKSTLTIVTWAEEEAGVVVAAIKAGPLFSRYRGLLPCLFSIILLGIIPLIVLLTSRDKPASSSDGQCKNLYGHPIPYTHC